MRRKLSFRRRLVADKLADLANLLIIGLGVANIVADSSIHWLILVVGGLFFGIVIYAAILFLTK